MSYEVIGKFSEIDLNDIFVNHNNEKSNMENVIKVLITAGIGMVLFGAIADVSFAADIGPYKNPTQLESIFEFIKWLIWLIKLVFSSVIGVIFTFAGWKWGTDLSGSAQSEAKKIMKNCLIGGLIIWTGAMIGDLFVGKLEEILIYHNPNGY